MSTDSKPRSFSTFEKLPEKIQERIKLEYPYGFSDELISFYDKDGIRVTALRFETDEKIYLVKMSIAAAKEIIEEDDDYDDDGNLKDNVKEDYEEKYSSDDED